MESSSPNNLQRIEGDTPVNALSPAQRKNDQSEENSAGQGYVPPDDTGKPGADNLENLVRFLKSQYGRASRKQPRGFTLIELLVVITITVLLFGLLMYPLLRSFEITQKAQLSVRVQGAARQTLEQLTREIQSAIYVYDNSGQRLLIPVADPQTGNAVNFRIPYGVIDLVPARMMMHCNSPNHPAGQPRDYPRRDADGNELAWPACPFDGSEDVEERPVTPVSPDTVVVRYFIGLRDPSKPYSNSNTNVLGLAGDTDNTFVLYRAEFNPYDANLIDSENGLRDGLRRDDFFYNTRQAPNGETFSSNWRRISKIVGPAKDVDLISFVTNDSTGALEGVTPAIQFVPNTVTNDVLTPADSSRVSEGDPFSPPTVYRASAGQWGPDFQVRLYKDNLKTVYYTQRDPSGLKIYRYGNNTPVFDITAWETNRQIVPSNPEMMFTVDPNKGQVAFSFPMSELGNIDDIRSINEEFARQYSQDPGTAIRYVALNVQGMQAANPAARIVPGTDRIVGPDWTPGENYGKPIQYRRISSLTDDPGPNEYKINYLTGTVMFYSLPQPVMPEVSGAVLDIRYSMQNNQGFNVAGGDILSADYTTKNVLAVQVSFRIYDGKGKLQQMRLANNVLVRNFRR